MNSLHLLVTTVVRHAPADRPSGYVYVIDFRDRRILMKSPVPESRYRWKDPNPRGGLRGAKGVASHAGRVLIANTDSVRVYDASWRLIAVLTSPLMGGVHVIQTPSSSARMSCTPPISGSVITATSLQDSS